MSQIKPQQGMLADNMGKPILISGLQLNGVSAEAGRDGDNITFWTRLYLTSDEPIFHTIANSFYNHIIFCLQKIDYQLDLNRSGCIILVVRPNNTGELWVDTAAVIVKVMIKRDVGAGEPIFEHDVADIIGMSFPLININDDDRVICLFREGWRFGLFADFNPSGQLDRSAMERDLGTLLRRMRYHELYSTIESQEKFTNIIEAGWFPFLEIIGAEFNELMVTFVSGFGLGDVEADLMGKFGKERLSKMFARWMARPHFASKEPILRSAIRSFEVGDPVAVLKTTLTEIEGILNEAYKKANGRPTRRINKLLDFATTSAQRRTGGSETLLFPSAFGNYLKKQVFKDFDLDAGDGKASSRHAVGHGAANADSYTMTRALQALLTLDQLAFYTSEVIGE